jgi:LysR family hydrogen peroxide-inducible transcriptional activator
MPSITQLEYIVAVDRFRHFSKAADFVHISQPTLSAQIQKAEEELGVTIFERAKKPLEPTAFGVKFIEQAKVVLREHARLIDSTKTESVDPSGDFRLAIIPTLVSSLLPRLVPVFAKHFPRMRILVDEMKTPDIIQALKDNFLDGGILATPLNEVVLEERPLFYEPFYVFCSPGHKFSATKSISEKQLETEDLWLLKEGHCMRTQVLSICGIEGRKIFPNVIFEGGSTETLLELVRSGLGYTLIPELHLKLLSSKERENQVRPIRNPVPLREVSLVHRRADWRERFLLKLTEVVQNQIPVELKKTPTGKAEILEIFVASES